MTPLVKHSPCKCEDRSSSRQNPHKKQDMVVWSICNLSTTGAETERSWGISRFGVQRDPFYGWRHHCATPTPTYTKEGWGESFVVESMTPWEAPTTHSPFVPHPVQLASVLLFWKCWFHQFPKMIPMPLRPNRSSHSSSLPPAGHFLPFYENNYCIVFGKKYGFVVKMNDKLWTCTM